MTRRGGREMCNGLQQLEVKMRKAEDEDLDELVLTIMTLSLVVDLMFPSNR